MHDDEVIRVGDPSSLLIDKVDPRSLFCFDDNRPPCIQQEACQGSPITGGAFEVRVYSEIQGNALVVWDASKYMPEIGNLDAQIEFSRYGIPNDDSGWEVIQPWISNTGVWNDPKQRVFGTFDDAYYRVSVRTPDGDIVRSDPVRARDYLPPNLRKMQREILRRWHNRGKRNELRRGYLLKFNRYGNRCSACRDRDSGVQMVSQCVQCYGTGRDPGYYLVPWCMYGEISSEASTESFSKEIGYKSSDPPIAIRMLNIPQVNPKDVWVDEVTDHRWMIGAAVYDVVLGTTPLFAKTTAAKLDFTHVIYQYRIPGRL